MIATPPSMDAPPIATPPAAGDAANLGLLTLTDEDLLEDAFPSGPHSTVAPVVATAIAPPSPFVLPPRAVSERRIVPRRNLTPLILGGVGVVLLVVVIAVAARGGGGDKPKPVIDPPTQPIAEPSPDAAVAEPDAAVMAGSATPRAGSGSAKKPVVVPPKKRPVVPPPQPPKKKWNPDELFLKKKTR